MSDIIEWEMTWDVDPLFLLHEGRYRLAERHTFGPLMEKPKEGEPDA